MPTLRTYLRDAQLFFRNARRGSPVMAACCTTVGHVHLAMRSVGGRPTDRVTLRENLVRDLRDMTTTVIEILTGLLVVITAIYVWLTYRAVDEARKARLQALRPHVVADFWPLGPNYPVIRLSNAGMAVALDVELEFTMERRSAKSGDPFTFQFSWPAMQVSANHQISTPDPPARSGRSHLDVLLQDYGPLRMSGTCCDMLGRVHSIDQTIDANAWWSAIGTRHELSAPAPTGEVGQQLHKLNKQLEQIDKNLKTKLGRR